MEGERKVNPKNATAAAPKEEQEETQIEKNTETEKKVEKKPRVQPSKNNEPLPAI